MLKIDESLMAEALADGQRYIETMQECTKADLCFMRDDRPTIYALGVMGALSATIQRQQTQIEKLEARLNELATGRAT